MSKFRLACHLIQFGGEQRDNPEKVLREVVDAGWDGVEGLGIEHPDELVEMATLARYLGLHIVNAGGPGLDRVKFNITLGNDAAEVPSLRRSEWGWRESKRCRFRECSTDARRRVSVLRRAPNQRLSSRPSWHIA